MRWTNEWIHSDGKYHEYLFLMEKNSVENNSSSKEAKQKNLNKNKYERVNNPLTIMPKRILETL